MMHSPSQGTMFLLFVLAKFSMPESIWPSIPRNCVSEGLVTVEHLQYLSCCESLLCLVRTNQPDNGTQYPWSLILNSFWKKPTLIQESKNKLLPRHGATADRSSCKKFRPLPPILRSNVCASHLESTRILDPLNMHVVVLRWALHLLWSCVLSPQLPPGT